MWEGRGEEPPEVQDAVPGFLAVGRAAQPWGEAVLLLRFQRGAVVVVVAVKAEVRLSVPFRFGIDALS